MRYRVSNSAPPRLRREAVFQTQGKIMPGRQVIKTLGQVNRILSTKKYFITRVGVESSQTLKKFTLTPQGTTNPGTKALPWIYFGKIKDKQTFDDFRKKMYPGSRYILVPEDSAAGQAIGWKSTGMGGDYVKSESLEPENEQYVVEVGEDFEDDESATSSASSSPKSDEPKGLLDQCVIM
jgi:hypothetical protein